jgi:dienelactone hydrolase
MGAAVALASVASHAEDAGPSRHLLFIGGPTLQSWSRISPDLFLVKGKVELLIAADGKTQTMRAALAHALGTRRPDAAMILPESGLGGEAVADTEADIGAMRDDLQKIGAHVVLAAPLHIAATPAPAEDAAMIAWMQAEAPRNGAVFGDYREAKLGVPGGAPSTPLARAEDLLARTALVRSSLDMSFQARPGLSARQLMASLMAARAALPDTGGSGPFPAVRLVEPALASHVFYRPANLAPFVANRMPVLIFGNGGCSNDAGDARLLLSEIASHGYLVIAPGFMKTGPGAYPKPAAPGAVPLGQPLGTSLADLARALDWVSKPADAAEGWQRFIDPTKIAVAGWSCGGLQAIKLAADPRIRTAIIFDSGVFNEGTFGVPGLPISKNNLAALHAPTLYVLGGLTDVAFANGSDDFERITHVPALLMSRDVGHSGTFWQPNGGLWAKVGVAWLDWQLKGEAAARQAFIGPDCGFCRDPAWSISAKGF